MAKYIHSFIRPFVQPDMPGHVWLHHQVSALRLKLTSFIHKYNDGRNFSINVNSIYYNFNSFI